MTPAEIVRKVPIGFEEDVSGTSYKGSYLRRFWEGRGQRFRGDLARHLRLTFWTWLSAPLPAGTNPGKRKTFLEG